MEEGPQAITVTFVDGVRRIDASDPTGLVFGRGADLDVDSNPFMHRQVGRFVAINGVWWVENLSGWSPLWLTAAGTTTLVACNDKAALCAVDHVVSFEAGACRYELHVHQSNPPTAVPVTAPPDDQTLTERRNQVHLTEEERLMVVALAEPRLRNPDTRAPMPTNDEVRRRLGWSTAKFNRKLDYLCVRLDRHGVDGVREPGRRARDRRRRMVEHLMGAGLITAADLDVLDAYPPAPEGST